MLYRTVHYEAKAGADIVARDARMSESGYPLNRSVKAQNKLVGDRQTLRGYVGMNVRYVTLRGVGDDQGFRGDCPSPNRLTSARN